jgi:NAD(P)-dependent dehydrogenase (short-subunit alcohol dehydrogenase family)
MEDAMMNQLDFCGRTVLITGAGRGLGLAYARAVGKLGATVLLHEVGADTDGTGTEPAIAENVAASLSLEGIAVHPFHAPINTRYDCHALVRSCLAVNGRLDAVIHNAGWVSYEQIEDLQDASFDHMMTIMAKAPLWIAQAAWSSMCEAGYGRIVLTTSCRALYPEYVQKGLVSYAAAKMAAVGIMNVLADEGAAHGIIVNAVSPVAKTRMWGVEGEPDDLKPGTVAPGVAFLASDACTEGGWVLRAANGQFHATRAAEAEGVDYPRDLRAVHAGTPAAVAMAWDRIAVLAQEPRS